MSYSSSARKSANAKKKGRLAKRRKIRTAAR
jgi:hypothetical protein